MSDPPKKLNLEFILNKDKGHSSDSDRSRRNSGSNHETNSSSHRDDPSSSSHRRERSQRPPRSGGASSTSSVQILPRSTPTPAGSSSAHMRMQLERSYRCNICARTFAEKGKYCSLSHAKSFLYCWAPGRGSRVFFIDPACLTRLLRISFATARKPQ